MTPPSVVDCIVDSGIIGAVINVDVNVDCDVDSGIIGAVINVEVDCDVDAGIIGAVVNVEVDCDVDAGIIGAVVNVDVNVDCGVDCGTIGTVVKVDCDFGIIGMVVVYVGKAIHGCDIWFMVVAYRKSPIGADDSSYLHDHQVYGGTYNTIPGSTTTSI
jgi:hypothetical protein